MTELWRICMTAIMKVPVMKSKNFVQYLDENSTVLAATGNHEDFDKIEMNISEVEGYINGGEQTDAVSHCRVLGFLFEHLPKNYKFKLENIL